MSLAFLDVPDVLSEVGEYYQVLEIDGGGSHNYHTIYYDTCDLDMYHMHHRGMVNRHKIRFRKYGSLRCGLPGGKEEGCQGGNCKNTHENRE